MGRAPCCDKDGLKKGPWTPEEDQKLVDYVQKHGHGRWRTLPKNAGLSRCGKSCRLRWTNYLRPDIKRGKFSSEEEDTIIQLHSVLGNKWSAIASQLPGRTDNEVKNFWNTHVRKKLLRMGIDPVTHSPRLDFSALQLNPSLCTNPSQLLAAGDPFVNAELLRIVTRLLSSRQISTLQQEQQPFLSNPGFQDQLLQQYSFPYQELRSTPIQPLADVLQPTPAANMGGQFHPGDDVPCSTLDSLSAAPEDSDLFAAVAHAMGFDPTSGEAYSFPSVMSTPASSPTPLNSSSTYINSITTTTEEERDSYCSSVLNFQDHLLDVGAYNM